MDGDVRRDGRVVLIDCTRAVNEPDAHKLASLLAQDGYTGVRVAVFIEADKVFTPDTGVYHAGFRYGL